MRAAGSLLGGMLLLMAACAPVAAQADDASRLELRAGYLVGVAMPFVRVRAFPERGTSDLNFELVLPKLWHAAGWRDALLPRLHLGGTANLAGRTSYGYLGALWTYDYARRGFAELSLGGLVHDGQLTGQDPRLARLGCRALYELGFNLGVRLSALSRVMLSFQHASNGRGVLSDCPFNEGLDVLGVRFGYRF